MISIDGPYGSASEEIYNYEIVMLIGAGIGITPFASILRDIIKRRKKGHKEALKFKKVYLFWLNRDQFSFEWFAELLKGFQIISLFIFFLFNIHTTTQQRRIWNTTDCSSMPPTSQEPTIDTTFAISCSPWLWTSPIKRLDWIASLTFDRELTGEDQIGIRSLISWLQNIDETKVKKEGKGGKCCNSLSLQTLESSFAAHMPCPAISSKSASVTPQKTSTFISRKRTFDFM